MNDASDGDLELMRRIDELHLELPFAGAHSRWLLTEVADRFIRVRSSANSQSSTIGTRYFHYPDPVLDDRSPPP